MSDLNIDIDHEMYMKFEDYRYNAEAEGARPMGFSAWKQTPIAQDYLARLEAKQPADAPAVDGDVVLAAADHLAALPVGQIDSVEGVVVEAGQVIRELREQLAAITAERDAAVRVSVRLSGEYERGWKGATESMLSIIERTLENPAGHKLTHIETLVKRFRIDYPKHGVRATSE